MMDGSYRCWTAGSSWSEPLVSNTGPVLRWTGPKQVLLDVSAVAVTRLDTEICGQRMADSSNGVLGTVGVGYAVGMTDDATNIALGAPYGFVTMEGGAYSEKRILPVTSLVALPDGMAATAAAAVLQPGLTARYLTLRTYRVFPEAPVIIRGVAGSVGSLVAHFVKQFGGLGIGIVKNAEQVSRVQSLPLAAVVVDGDAAALARALAPYGGGAVVAYDFVGGSGAHALLDALAPLGSLVSAGQVAGLPPLLDPGLLTPRSLFYTRPLLQHHLQARIEQLLAHFDIFGLVQDRHIPVPAPVVWDWSRLSEALKAVQERQYPMLVCQRNVMAQREA
jgi:NADPH2:quinone reductase